MSLCKSFLAKFRRFSNFLNSKRLRQIFDYLSLSNISEDIYRFDTSIARGLASYTGPVWEFEVIDGDVGSIGGCGRYDNLIGKYLDQSKQIPALLCFAGQQWRSPFALLTRVDGRCLSMHRMFGVGCGKS